MWLNYRSSLLVMSCQNQQLSVCLLYCGVNINEWSCMNEKTKNTFFLLVVQAIVSKRTRIILVNGCFIRKAASVEKEMFHANLAQRKEGE